MASDFLVAEPVKMPRAFGYTQTQPNLIKMTSPSRTDGVLKADLTAPHLLAVLTVLTVSGYMIEASYPPDSPLSLPYLLSPPPFSITAAATYLVECHDVWLTELQRRMFSMAVEVGTRSLVGFMSCKECSKLRSWLPSDHVH